MASCGKRLGSCLSLLSLILLIVFYSISIRGESKQVQPTYDYRFEEVPSESGMRRGINIGNALEAPNEGEWGVYIQDDYFRIIREAGFDTVRIPIRWSSHAGNYPPYRIDENFFNRVDHVVSKALEQNLITIINIHHYGELMYDPAGHRDRFIALWRQISEHYKDYPETLYFELLNEPSYYLTDNIWNQLVNDTVEIIRKTNPVRKIVIGPTRWNSVYKLEDLKPPDDDNIIVTFHFYTPFEFTHQGASWVSPSPPVGRKWMGTEAEKKQITDELDIAFKWAMQHNNITLLMGEFGAYSRADMDSRVRWTHFVAREAEKRGIAWCYWEFCSGFGVYDPVKREWRTMLLTALIPKAVNNHYVSVETEYGSFSGVDWYEEGTYATLSAKETSVGFPILMVFDHFEGLKPQDRVINASTVEIYVDGPRKIKAVWRKDITPILLIIILCVVCLIGVLLYKKRRPSG